MRFLRILVLFSTLLALSSAGSWAHQELDHGPRPDLPPDVPEAALAQARDAGKALGRTLLGRLSRELRAGGVVPALEVCSRVAQETAASHSSEKMTVRRVTLKPRNPADTPDAWEKEHLQVLAMLHEEDHLPTELGRVLEDDRGKVFRWLKPIKISDPCLKCHGDPATFEPELKATLESLYPDDRATGYRLGDFRGATSVTIRLDTPDPSSDDGP